MYITRNNFNFLFQNLAASMSSQSFQTSADDFCRGGLYYRITQVYNITTQVPFLPDPDPDPQIRFWKSRIRIRATQNFLIRPDPDILKNAILILKTKRHLKAFYHLILTSIDSLRKKSYNNCFRNCNLENTI